MRFKVRIPHGIVERHIGLLLILVIITLAVGGVIQIVPLFKIASTVEPIKGIRPYSPLELAGRNIYIKEGCVGCHSQMVRPLTDEKDRYGEYSRAAESMYDFPFLWGSKRTGPDLARVGGKYSNQWQYDHLVNPRQLVPQSVMPAYAHLAKNKLDYDDIAEHLKVMRRLGVPYTNEMINNAKADLMAQANGLANHDDLIYRYPKAVVVDTSDFIGDSEDNVVVTKMDAIVAYLQILGRMAEFDQEQQQ